MNPALRETAAHVFVESLDAPELDDDDRHHLVRVLRIRPSDRLSVTDGTARWAVARLVDGALSLVDGIHAEGAAVPTADSVLTIGSAIPKGDRPEWIVQKLTELGLDRIVLFEAARSVVRWDERKRALQRGRLRRVAREAAMQCRRLSLPVVDVVTWGDVLELPDLALAEPGGRAGWWVPSDEPSKPAVRTVVIGPEGGFSPDELARVPDHVALLPTILRVETAAIAAGALLVASRDVC